MNSNRAIKTILCATNFSAASDEAFTAASSLAAEHTARLIVVHVATPQVPGIGATESIVLHDDYLGAVEARLRALQSRIPDVPMQFRIEEGHPSIEILKLARATRADLIVLGCPDAVGLSLPPSTSHELTALAPCPVVKVTAEGIAHTADSRLKHLSHEHSANAREPHETV